MWLVLIGWGECAFKKAQALRNVARLIDQFFGQFCPTPPKERK